MDQMKTIQATSGEYIKFRPSKVKVIETDEYAIVFNPRTGEEVLTGINGHEDPFVLQYPSMLDIGIMGHCDNKCSFCYQGDGYEPNMSLDGFRQLIYQSKEYVNQVALGGRGDPNQHENFKEILECCVENRIVPNYTTSGINLTTEQTLLSKQYCGAVAVSAYGKDHTWKALKRLMEIEMKTNIHYVVTKQNIMDVCELIQGKDIFNGNVDLEKLNAIVFLLFKPQGRGKNLDWSPTQDQIDVFAELIKSPETTFKIGMDSCLINKVAQSRKLTPTEEMYADTCEGARMSCYITSDLRLVPCSFGNHLKYGIDISKGNFQEVWKTGHSFTKFRKVLSVNKACCPFTVIGF